MKFSDTGRNFSQIHGDPDKKNTIEIEFHLWTKRATRQKPGIEAEGGYTCASIPGVLKKELPK